MNNMEIAITAPSWWLVVELPCRKTNPTEAVTNVTIAKVRKRPMGTVAMAPNTSRARAKKGWPSRYCPTGVLMISAS